MHFWFLFGETLTDQGSKASPKGPIHRKDEMVELRRLRVLFGNLGDLASLAKLAKLADNLSLSGKRLPQLRRDWSDFLRRPDIRAVVNGAIGRTFESQFRPPVRVCTLFVCLLRYVRLASVLRDQLAPGLSG